MEHQSTAFRQIVSYISNLTDKLILSEIYPVIAKKLDVSSKTIENYTKSRKLSAEEIPFVLDALMDIVEETRSKRQEDNKAFYLNTRILYELSWDFLESSINERAFIALILNNYRIFHTDHKDLKSQYLCQTYSNRYIDFDNVYVKNKALYNKLCDKIELHNVTFLIGEKKSGKTPLVKYYVKMDKEEKNKFNSYFFFKGDNLNLEYILSQIVFTFTGHSLINYNLETKKIKVDKYLKAQNSLIVIEDFNKAEVERLKEILEFFAGIENIRILITGNQKERSVTAMLKNAGIQSSSMTITAEYSMTDWEKYVSQMSENIKEVSYVIENEPEIMQWCFDLNKRSIYLTGDILKRMSKEIFFTNSNLQIEKERFIDSIYNAAESDEELDKIYQNAKVKGRDVEIMFLTIIAMFKNPLNWFELNKLWDYYTKSESNTNDTSNYAVRKVVSYCCKKLYLEKENDNETSDDFFTVHDYFRKFIKRKLMAGDEICKKAAEVWIDYYARETECYSKSSSSSKLLKKLDDNNNNGNLRISNIFEVLDYCEVTEKWDSYYILSRNVSRYIAGRGICGKEKNNYLYKCALAARKLGNYNNEYEALIYFCIVGCRIRDFNNVEEAIKRLDEINVIGNNVDKRNRCKYSHVKGLYFLAKREFNAAKDSFENYLSTADILIHQYDDSIENQTDIELLKYDIMSTERWRSECLCQMALSEPANAENYCKEAAPIFEKARLFFEKIGRRRAAAHCILNRARINFYAYGLNSTTEKYMMEVDEVKTTLHEDVLYGMTYREFMEKVSAAIKKNNKKAK